MSIKITISGVLVVLSSLSQSAFAADSATINKGKQLYNQSCTFCHQPDAIGKPGFAPSLSNPELLSISSDAFLEKTIRDGRTGTGMPPFSYLGRKDVKAIVAYLRSHAKGPNTSASVDKQPKAKGSAKRGKPLFNDICSTCHGVKGDGYAAGGTGTAIGKSGFLDKASDGFIRETVKYGRSNTRMLGFSGPEAIANLEDKEIEDIITYMRTLAK